MKGVSAASRQPHPRLFSLRKGVKPPQAQGCCSLTPLEGYNWKQVAAEQSCLAGEYPNCFTPP